MGYIFEQDAIDEIAKRIEDKVRELVKEELKFIKDNKFKKD